MAARIEFFECCAFANYMRILAPRFGITWRHWPNGGFRHPKTAADLQKMGVMAGPWDYYIRRAGFPTLWLEFKRKGEKTSPSQNQWLDCLLPLGDEFDVAFTAIEGLERLTDHKFLPEGAYLLTGNSIRIPIRIQERA